MDDIANEKREQSEEKNDDALEELSLVAAITADLKGLESMASKAIDEEFAKRMEALPPEEQKRMEDDLRAEAQGVGKIGVRLKPRVMPKPKDVVGEINKALAESLAAKLSAKLASEENESETAKEQTPEVEKAKTPEVRGKQLVFSVIKAGNGTQVSPARRRAPSRENGSAKKRPSNFTFNFAAENSSEKRRKLDNEQGKNNKVDRHKKAMERIKEMRKREEDARKKRESEAKKEEQPSQLAFDPKQMLPAAMAPAPVRVPMMMVPPHSLMGVPSFPPPIGGVKGMSPQQAAQAFPGLNIPQPGVTYPVDLSWSNQAYGASSATYDPSKAAYNPAQAAALSPPVKPPAPTGSVSMEVDPPVAPPKTPPEAPRSPPSANPLTKTPNGASTDGPSLPGGLAPPPNFPPPKDLSMSVPKISSPSPSTANGKGDGAAAPSSSDPDLQSEMMKRIMAHLQATQGPPAADGSPKKKKIEAGGFEKAGTSNRHWGKREELKKKD